MDYQVMLEDGSVITLQNAGDLNTNGTFASVNNRALLSVKVGDSLISKNTIVGIFPIGEGTIELDYELTLGIGQGMKISKGSHNQIDLMKVDSEINKEAFFEFGGGLYNRNYFKKIIPNPANQQITEPSSV